MPKSARALGALDIKRLHKPGLHSVGTVAGLCLQVKDTGARSWILRTTIAARRVEMGLGGYPSVTLAQAIEQARATLQVIRNGTDPLADRREKRATVEWTFQRTAEAYIAAHKAGWKSDKHRAQWESTLAAYVHPKIGPKHVRDVTKSDVLAIIEPHWSSKNETMVRVRSRIELILSYAMQREYRPEGLNPARWRGNLDSALPKPSKVAEVEHFEALPIDDMPGFMQRLRSASGMSARALEFSILTVSRTGSVRAATWSEVDMDKRIWTIPKEHMKSGRPHRVPLSDEAIALLNALPRAAQDEFVFPGAKKERPLSDMSLTAVMRRMKLTAVPHGFRSTFSDWCAERTSTPAEVREMALAHAIGDETEAAYRRGDLFDKRRELMQLWAKFGRSPELAKTP
ncbi:tyrosine-type recombinase/integrase [Pseudorhodoferax sp.]|uniref:tyrosine-type recombinase/integrase n=1 Tax=Pseudorhodoferax sp. TaxID=1993553 RepID=UPI002DD6B28F|nr:integrase arm-type DNA-binding domain-containing protein [Pseudorhodoferax sp.]